MEKKDDKLPHDFMKALEGIDFASEKERDAFFAKFFGETFTDDSDEELSAEEEALALVHEAYGLEPEEARDNLELALVLDIDCIEAYEMLGLMEESLEISMVFYEKAIALGRERFMGDFLEQHREHLWLIPETHPFLRSMYHYANVLYNLGMLEESLLYMEEVILLNPMDNMGVRVLFMLALIEADDRKKYKAYARMYKDDAGAARLFTDVLYAFKYNADKDEALTLLKKAVAQNKYIVGKLLGTSDIKPITNGIVIGEESEADEYAIYATTVWIETPGALAWLRQYTSKLRLHNPKKE